MHFGKILVAALVLAGGLAVARPEETDETPKKTIQFRSPDGKFAFRYGKNSKNDTETYLLIEKASGKVVKKVAESEEDPGPSLRFVMEKVLWRSDSKAFAVTAFLWKRGTSLIVFARDGSTFREIELPELSIEIPDTEKKGKDFPHINQLDSTTAKGWEKDGSLLVEIETIVDGEGGTLTATRTVVLGFANSAKAKILKSTIKFATENQ